jgi:hypothetical protein
MASKTGDRDLLRELSTMIVKVHELQAETNIVNILIKKLKVYKKPGYLSSMLSRKMSFCIDATKQATESLLVLG